MKRRILASLVGLAAASCFAQAWPSKQPIKLVAVFPPGGSVDQVARILSQPLQAQLNQTVIVENKGGASGSIGAAFVAQSPADGYTFAVVFDSHAVNPALIPGLPYDVKKDLAAISLIGTAAMTIATPATSEYKSFGDVVTALKANKSVSYGSIGNGSLAHLAMTLLGKSNNLAWQHVPYKGGGPMMQDAIGGHVPMVVGSVFVVKPHIDSGRVRALAVTTAKRSPELPNVPTLAELGYGQFEAPAWWAVLAPAKTPPEIIAKMNAAMNAVMQNPDVA
ncbi:MAG TPA: tripartite tricarboxylate transporter substrate binding protein, partial [Casimicrobium sp.]|nr:tripartite tricarboxylate transporter substrate binding protein [Casimicrobium sp.]